MTDQLLTHLGDLIGGAFSLSQATFRRLVSLPEGQTFALLVVLAAGLSLAVGQSIILFINRVKPVRFVVSLLLNAVLFVFGFLFLVFSTWLIGWLPGFTQIPWRDLVQALGLSYAPLIFSFLGALPYAGVPILNGLAVWHLLSMVTGVSAIAQMGATNAFAYVAFGWFTLRLLEGTIGRPIAQLGRRLTQRVAGVDLVSERSELAGVVEAGSKTRSVPLGSQSGAQRSVKTSAGDSATEPILRSSAAIPQPFAADITAQSANLAAIQMPSQDLSLIHI